MKVFVLVFVAVVCALLPSDGGAEKQTPTLHALAKRSATFLSKAAYLNRRSSRTAFDEFFADFQKADQDTFMTGMAAEFLGSKHVHDYLESIGSSMSDVDAIAREKTGLGGEELDMVKALMILHMAGYDTDQLLQD